VVRDIPAMRYRAALIALLATTGCATAVGPTAARPRADRPAPDWPWPVSRTVADSVRTEVLSPAVRLHTLVSVTAPWRAAVLDVDLAACVTVRVLKGGETAVGRRTTSALLAMLPSESRPLAAVNGDFFTFTPPGVPTGAHVEGGRVLAGPGRRPAFVVDGAGRPSVQVLSAAGVMQGRVGDVALGGWNRPDLLEAGVLDAAWGSAPDSTVSGRWRLLPLAGARQPRPSAGWTERFVVDDRGVDRAPTGDTLLLVRIPEGNAPGLRVGDTVTVAMRLGTVAPVEAVGGFPLLLTRGELAAGVETAGAASFRGLNPRTAVGVAAGGRRLLLVVVDGRQPGWSVGMTTVETARLMQALGAEEALNLDGGGSSALARFDARRGRPRLATRPSDLTGERPVGNALALLDRCAP
jgi:hypothetical protein